MINFICSVNKHEENFNCFKKTFHPWKERFKVYDRDQDEIYKRIKCIWKEGELEHQYHAVINTKTGNIYLDCRRRELFAKNVSLVITRPLHTVVKTLWHATMAGPAACEFFKILMGRQSLKGGLRNLGMSMLDIALTPLCGLAMTVASIAMVLLSPFSPNLLYRGRDINVCLERLMHHTDNLFRAEFPGLSPCLSPMANLSEIKKYVKLRKKGVPLTEEIVNIGLENCAKAQIEFRRNHRAFFNNFWRLFPKDQPYISPAA